MRSEAGWPPQAAPARRAGEASERTPGEERDAAWAALRGIALTAGQSDQGRLVCHDRHDPAHSPLDMMRTRISQAMAEHGWRRIAVTSPTKGCGKTFVSANLALSLARRRSLRIGLMDLDLRLPSLARVFGVQEAGSLAGLLDGDTPTGAHFRRLGDNLAIAFNGRRQTDSAERLGDPRMAATLARIDAELAPDLTIFDLPPMLACDDFLAFLPRVDCALFVAGGGITRAEEIRRCCQLIEGRVPLLGIVLNQADDPEPERYHYGSGEA